MSDRKYRQRGYQDDDRGRDARSAPGPRREPGLKPGGRGLGKPTATVFRCKVCGQENTIQELSTGAVCGHCGADLHTCTHCSHFDTSAPNQCRQPAAERVSAKAKRNDCSYFAPRQTREFAKESASPHDAKAAFDALFDL